MLQTLPDRTEGDTIALTISVVGDDGSAESLTGATVNAAARKHGEQVNVTPTSQSVTDGAGGIVSVIFNPGLITSGVWTVQVQVTKVTGEVRTVAIRAITITDSII